MLATRAELRLGLPFPRSSSCSSSVPTTTISPCSPEHRHQLGSGRGTLAPAQSEGRAGSTSPRCPSLSQRLLRGPGGASALQRAGETYPPPAPPAGGGQGRAWSLTSFPCSQQELQLWLPEPGWGVEGYAPRDFALLQLVLDCRGGVSLTSIQILFPGRPFSPVITFSNCILSLRLSWGGL